jgi:hypothetical protein
MSMNPNVASMRVDGGLFESRRRLWTTSGGGRRVEGGDLVEGGTA